MCLIDEWCSTWIFPDGELTTIIPNLVAASRSVRLEYQQMKF